MYLHHLLGVFYHPRDEWRLIREEHYSLARCFTSHIVVMAAIPPLAAFIGTTVVGWSIGGGEFVKLTAGSALPIAIAFYFALLAGVALMTGLTHWMKRSYGSDPSLDDCMVLIAFTATPMFVAGLSALVPILWLNVLIGMAALVHTIYLLYTGTPVIMNIPEDRAFIFSTSILTVGLVVLVGTMAMSAVLWGTLLMPTFTQ